MITKLSCSLLLWLDLLNEGRQKSIIWIEISNEFGPKKNEQFANANCCLVYMPTITGIMDWIHTAFWCICPLSQGLWTEYTLLSGVYAHCHGDYGLNTHCFLVFMPTVTGTVWNKYTLLSGVYAHCHRDYGLNTHCCLVYIHRNPGTDLMSGCPRPVFDRQSLLQVTGVLSIQLSRCNLSCYLLISDNPLCWNSINLVINRI